MCEKSTSYAIGEIEKIAAQTVLLNNDHPKSNDQMNLHVKLLTIADRNKGGESASFSDERSQRGQFGWATLGNVHVPYIFRGEEKYCSVRMLEISALSSYLGILHQDIYSCTNIRSFYITPAEAQLFNQINFFHSDSQFSHDKFTNRDLVVSLADAEEFYKFMVACYSKLLNGGVYRSSRFGFVRINDGSVVPYTMFNEKKVVPLFYFDGEVGQLTVKAIKLTGWDLSYLKFCCKVQGIHNQLFAQDTCSVISLEDVKNYFPPGTLFEDHWPSNVTNTKLLVSRKTQASTTGQWTKQPIMSPNNEHNGVAEKPPVEKLVYKNNSKIIHPGPLYNTHATVQRDSHQLYYMNMI